MSQIKITLGLYKYTRYRENLFRDLLFRFTPPSKLNDPFEGQPDIGELIHFLTSGGGEEKYEGAREDLLKTVKTKPVWHDDIGVFCLSWTKHSLPMWAHYADNHRGIIIEFDGNHAFFHQQINTEEKKTIPDELFGKLVPVTYDKVRLKTPVRAKDPFYFLLKNKGDDWMHEKEVRVFMPLDKKDNGVDLFYIPGDAITKVILGARSKKDQIVKEIRKAKERNPQLRRLVVEEARLHPSLYHVQYNKVEY